MFYKVCISCIRRRISILIIPFLIVSLIFILHQVLIFSKLSDRSEIIAKPALIRGIHEQQARFYQPSQDNKFVCTHSLEEIEFRKINDDYCDCMDGSDEPGNNACTNGIFYCFNQKHIPKSVASTKVNDGICDCCDGSDEWKNDNKLKDLDRQGAFQKNAYRYHPPCLNVC